MRPFTSSHGFIGIALLLLALPPRAGMAQAPATVVITAPRPYQEAEYAPTMARIRRLLAHQPARAGTWDCLAPQPWHPPVRSWNLSTPMALDNLALDSRVRCGRSHIWTKDTTLRRGLDAFERQDYTAALDLFQDAYQKMGMKDAALMLAKMQLDGLGTPRNPAAAIRWLEEVADGRDAVSDWMWFNPASSQGVTAPIEATVMLARIHARGAGVPPDPAQARHWYARAAASGVVLSGEPEAVVLGLAPAASGATSNGAATPLAPLAAAGPAAPAAPIALRRSGEASAARRAQAEGLDPPLQVDPAFMVVRITGLRAIPWKSYRAMRAAVAAFEANKSLAPDAVFSFALLPPAGKTLPSNFRLRVRTRDGEEFPIALDNGELFQLPALPNAGMDAELVSNFRGEPLRIGLLVHTRSVPPEQERLGDVRLRNEINQAIADVDHPSEDPNCLRKRAGHNGCKARPRATVWHKPRAPAMGASIVEGGRREALASDKDPGSPSYKMPVYSARWGNDAIIEFDYKGLLRPPRLSEVAIYDATD